MSPRPEKFRAVRWLLPAAALTLTPKCLLCLLAYAGLGAALRLGGPEICGAPGGSPDSWASSVVLLGVAGGFAVMVANLKSLRGLWRKRLTVPLPSSVARVASDLR